MKSQAQIERLPDLGLVVLPAGPSPFSNLWWHVTPFTFR